MFCLILTGACGSGKTTISKLLANQGNCKRICEDDLWKQYYGKNRGIFGTDEHRVKRQWIHNFIFEEILSHYKENFFFVIDATVHESAPEAYYEYSKFFEEHNIKWQLYVLHPRLEVAVKRDSERTEWVAGPERVKSLWKKFTGNVFPKECFIDNSDETPDQTTEHILNTLRVNTFGMDYI